MSRAVSAPMNLDLWKSEIENAFVVKLNACLGQLSGREVERLDFGVFPWQGGIEVSFLLTGDECDHNDIAAWPNYNVSGMSEGRWPEAVPLCKEMQRLWESDKKSSETFFRAVAEIAAADPVASLIRRFSRSPNFKTTLYDPDDKRSVNFCG